MYKKSQEIVAFLILFYEIFKGIFFNLVNICEYLIK